jgi:outer membrane protein assembly factor BamB
MQICFCEYSGRQDPCQHISNLPVDEPHDDVVIRVVSPARGVPYNARHPCGRQIATETAHPENIPIMRMHPRTFLRRGVATLSCLLLVTIATVRAGETWTSFRGPVDQGHSDATGLPLEWSETENVVWKTPIPGKAWSSPVVWNDRIWLTNASEDGTQLSVVCVDRESGKILIRKRLRVVAAPQYCHPFNSYASPSPVIEEGRVYVTFGSPFVGCLDSESGDVIWQRTDFVCNHFRGSGSSPFLYENLLILHFDGSDHQFVVAMDKKTGETIWKTKRTVDFQDIDPETGGPSREGDLRKAYSTPVIIEVDGRPLLISVASMACYAYDPGTGEEIWRVENQGSHSGSSRPILGHGLVFVTTGTGRELWAVRPDGQGCVTDTHVVWRYDRAVPHRSSPILVGDHIFLVDDNGVAACVDAKTGEEMWRKRVGGNFSASPIHAEGRIYFLDQEGKTTVIAASPDYEVLAVNELEDGFMGSPAVAGESLILRTKTSLYRIEE